MRWIVATVLLVTTVTVAAAQGTTYDLVVANGRVMDPESGLDAVRHVGIMGGRVAVVSEAPLRGKRVIDATNHVVAPGFVDLHEHGQQEESYRMMVRDGVTSAFELEVGTEDVAKWYAEREGGQLVNYGVSIGHIRVRMKVLGDPSKDLLPSGVGGTGTATEAQVAEMEALMRKGLAEGAVAAGFGSAYTPGAPMSSRRGIMSAVPTIAPAIVLVDSTRDRPSAVRHAKPVSCEARMAARFTPIGTASSQSIVSSPPERMPPAHGASTA